MQNVAGVKKVAAQHGASVSLLDADWNYVFRQGTAGLMMKGMNEKQKAMMDRVRSAKATTGVAMVGMPRAAQVEYALTRDAGLQRAADGSSAIKINLNEKAGCHAHSYGSHCKV